MFKALLDTSAYLDVRRAGKNLRSDWAQNTLRHLGEYKSHHPRLSISSFTAFEILDGLYRGPGAEAAARFTIEVLPTYEVIYPDAEITYLAAEIHAALANARQSIGVADTFIAATAVAKGMTLVNANTRHFPRIREMGFPIALSNWRDA